MNLNIIIKSLSYLSSFENQYSNKVYSCVIHADKVPRQQRAKQAPCLVCDKFLQHSLQLSLKQNTKERVSARQDTEGRLGSGSHVYNRTALPSCNTQSKYDMLLFSMAANLVDKKSLHTVAFWFTTG